MPRFKCPNEKCENHTKIDLIPHVKFIWSEKNHRLESEHDPCPLCGSRRFVVEEEGNITLPWFKAENARNYQNKNISKKHNQFNY